MDAFSLSQHVKHLASACSATLNIEERTKLELALCQLKDAIPFEMIQLWGKVTGKQTITDAGLEADYFIAVGTNCYGHSGFPQRRFFWCTTNNYTFSELPAARVLASPIFDQVQSLF